ncbi:uncharacterized protein FIBRA_08333 [Fibroporia radiculosa]|uniref:FAD-binding domain-containing protein n=1 Tax=Fibroporia radiculosa TaxID=599839 RepID=J4ICA8_9APHY|nr:uncharacterized protein FIBRA_08333 [Fibroporia radiculosa]CCM06086.1 predicted protein [Fibroporia radiculosa]
MIKVFYQWGLEEDFRKISMVGQHMALTRCKVALSGGWGEGFEVGGVGEFVQMHFADFRKLLYESALKFGAKIRTKVMVESLSPEAAKPCVTLASGEKLYADVLIGADGLCSISRATMLGDADRMTRKKLVLFNALIAREPMMADPDLRSMLTDNQYSKFILWFGGGRGASGFATRSNEYCLQVFARDNDYPFPVSTVDKQELIGALGPCELRLRKLAEMAHNVIAVPIIDQPHLEDWLHKDGRFLVIGEAAHPLTTGSTYTAGLAAGDGMMLGRLFSHLHEPEQITPFLTAVEEQRQQRIARALEIQNTNPVAMSMPAGVEDNKQSLAVAEQIERMSESEYNELADEALRAVFAYDPEEEADDWWMQWGILQERSVKIVPVTFETITVVEENEQV